MVCLLRSRATWTWTETSFCHQSSAGSVLCNPLCPLPYSCEGPVAKTPAWPTGARFRRGTPRLAHIEKAKHKMHSLGKNHLFRACFQSWKSIYRKKTESSCTFVIFIYPVHTKNTSILLLGFSNNLPVLKKVMAPVQGADGWWQEGQSSQVGPRKRLSWQMQVPQRQSPLPAHIFLSWDRQDSKLRGHSHAWPRICWETHIRTHMSWDKKNNRIMEF